MRRFGVACLGVAGIPEFPEDEEECVGEDSPNQCRVGYELCEFRCGGCAVDLHLGGRSIWEKTLHQLLDVLWTNGLLQHEAPNSV